MAINPDQIGLVAADQCSRIRILCFFSHLKKNTTFYVFLNCCTRFLEQCFQKPDIWLFNVYCSSSLLSESDTAQRSHSMFAPGNPTTAASATV